MLVKLTWSVCAGLAYLAIFPPKVCRLNLSTCRLSACIVAFSLVPAVACADDGYKMLSDVLAVGLPVIAAGVSVAHDDASGFLQLAKSEAFTLATTGILKSTIDETRPNGRDNKSFPSGHTAVAFAAAQYMQMKGGWEYGIPAYIAASAVGYARVQADEHYWHDVLAGAAIGIASSYFFTDNQEKTKFSVIFGPHSAFAQFSSKW